MLTSSATATARPTAYQDALGVLEGIAKFDGPEHSVHVRLAPLKHDGALEGVVLDLGTPDWSAVVVDAEGWRVVALPPVRFRRPRTLHPLALPVHGGQVSELLEALNVPEDTFHLLACWLVGALRPCGPYALLELIGGQGTSKSTTARFIKSVLDPSSGALRTTPRSEEDLMIAAQSQHVLCFDNLSDIPVWLSDALCRLATGGGLSKRELFSDDGEVVLEAMRPVILTGITELATRPDLLDRTIRLELPLIPPSKRRPVEEVEATFARLAPRVLGALLEAVSLALRDGKQVAQTLRELPRMADLAVWVTAAEPALGVAREEFLRQFAENRAQGDNAALEGHPIPGVLQAFMEGRATWTGTVKTLLEALESTLETAKNGNPKKPKDWPTSPKSLAGALRRYAPVLRSAALLEVSFSKPGKAGVIVTVTSLPQTPKNSQPNAILNPEKCEERSSPRSPNPPPHARQGKSSEHLSASGSPDVHPSADVHATSTTMFTGQSADLDAKQTPRALEGEHGEHLSPPLSKWSHMNIETDWGNDG